MSSHSGGNAPHFSSACARKCVCWLCEVILVFRARRYQRGLRQWIAAAVAFGFALHALLIPLANGKPVPWEASANGALFVICHGAGANSGGDQDQPTEQPQHDSHCVLCGQANSCAVLSAATVVVSLDLGTFFQLAVPPRSQVTEHRSPTGEYQRGPPTHALIAG
jgi:hypothetical protein